ncbi:hypothetical protein BS47DRAFT_1365132 [Hydnum rufescens UP504]|uniref:Uncharacterized protein n=1 Tax=Hydnum rufescens UP504 TaxID=1448309 RepID=A0A9P6ARR0_9AGAM|nr:hypothetical protein BS47DRAFT_1365132 [Hydnum rufescens UP504]
MWQSPHLAGMNSKMGKECIGTLEVEETPPAEDAVVPSGALHHPHKGQEVGSSGGTPSMVQDPPAEDAVMHSGGSHHPHKDPELVGLTLLTLLLTWELSEASVEHMLSHRTLHMVKLRTAVKYHLLSIGGTS